MNMLALVLLVAQSQQWGDLGTVSLKKVEIQLRPSETVYLPDDGGCLIRRYGQFTICSDLSGQLPDVIEGPLKFGIQLKEQRAPTIATDSQWAHITAPTKRGWDVRFAGLFGAISCDRWLGKAYPPKHGRIPYPRQIGNDRKERIAVYALINVKQRGPNPNPTVRIAMDSQWRAVDQWVSPRGELRALFAIPSANRKKLVLYSGDFAKETAKVVSTRVVPSVPGYIWDADLKTNRVLFRDPNPNTVREWDGVRASWVKLATTDQAAPHRYFRSHLLGSYRAGSAFPSELAVFSKDRKRVTRIAGFSYVAASASQQFLLLRKTADESLWRADFHTPGRT